MSSASTNTRWIIPRLEMINECLRDTTKKWSAKKIHEQVCKRMRQDYGEKGKVSLTTIRDDLKFLCYDLRAPIDYKEEGTTHYYYLENPNYLFKINNVSPEDEKSFGEAITLLDHFGGFDNGKQLKKLYQKLGFNLEARNKRGKRILSFQGTPNVKGVEHLQEIFQAIMQEKVMTIVYQRFDESEPRLRVIHPYLLKEYKRLWYLMGYNEERMEIRVFALDRMKALDVIDREYRESEYEDDEDHFKDIVGVTVPKGEPTEDVELVFSPSRAPYLKTLSIHHSQQILKEYPSGNLRIGLKLKINPELINELFSYGKDVHVVKPQRLIDLLNKGTIEMLNSRE